MHNSISYVVCCNTSCKESGNIKKNSSKCSTCRKTLDVLSLNLLNKQFCPKSENCNTNLCLLLHPSKNHQSPPYISPCAKGLYCKDDACLFLHPNGFGIWVVHD